jgi:hypothetical protein
VAGVFSGALSTVSSGLNSLAAVTLQAISNKIKNLKKLIISTSSSEHLLRTLVVFLLNYFKIRYDQFVDSTVDESKITLNLTGPLHVILGLCDGPLRPQVE